MNNGLIPLWQWGSFGWNYLISCIIENKHACDETAEGSKGHCTRILPLPRKFSTSLCNGGRACSVRDYSKQVTAISVCFCLAYGSNLGTFCFPVGNILMEISNIRHSFPIRFWGSNWNWESGAATTKVTLYHEYDPVVHEFFIISSTFVVSIWQTHL